MGYGNSQATAMSSSLVGDDERGKDVSLACGCLFRCRRLSPCNHMQALMDDSVGQEVLPLPPPQPCVFLSMSECGIDKRPMMTEP